MFGAVQKQKHFLGIPYQGMVTATKLSDVSEMIQTVFDSGCNNTQWNLYGFLKGGMYNSDNDSFRIERAVGSKSDYRQLCADAEQNNADIIFSSSVQHVYRAGLFEKRNTCKKMSGDYAYQYFYKKNLNSANKDFSWLLLKPNLLLKKTEKLIKDYLHYGGDGLLLSDVGDELYSDYGEKYSSRNDTAELQIKQLDYVKQKAKNVWIDGASAYLTSHVNGIVNAPCESSHYDIQSFELPLFSLIFHGVLPITYTPVNTDESIIQVRMLKCLETGTVPYFRLTANSPQIYADTKLEFLLNTSFKRWQEKCTDFCKTYTSVCGELTDKVIVGYEIIGDVRKVTYSDGSIVYVTATALSEKGLLVMPNWFKTESGDELKKTIFDYIQEHLGYCLVSDGFSAETDKYGTTVCVSMKNYGFSAPHAMQKSELLLLDDTGKVIDAVSCGELSDFQPGVNVSLYADFLFPSTKKSYYLGYRITNSAGTGARLGNNTVFENNINILGRVR